MAFSASVEFSQLFFPPREFLLFRCRGQQHRHDGRSDRLACLRAAANRLAAADVDAIGGTRAVGPVVARLPGLFVSGSPDAARPDHPTRRHLSQVPGRPGPSHRPSPPTWPAPTNLLRKTIWTAILFMPVGVLLARLPGPRLAQRPILAVALAAGFRGGRFGGIDAAVRLLAQLRERRCDSRHPGSFRGLASLHRLASAGRSTPAGESFAWPPCCRMCAGSCSPSGSGILAFVNWQPFDWIGDPAQVARRLHRDVARAFCRLSSNFGRARF